jgi:type II secretory pathway component PulF
MKSIFAKKMTPEALRERITALKNRAAEIVEKIQAEESSLAALGAEGKDIGPTLDQITRLHTERASIPASLEILENEILSIELEAVVSRVQKEKAEAERILKALRESWATVFDAFARFKTRAGELQIEKLKGYNRSPAEILKNFDLPNMANLFEDASKSYFATAEKYAVGNAERNHRNRQTA